MTNIVGGLIIAAFASFLTFILTMFVNKKKVVQYDVFSMPLLRFTPKKERTLAVSVDKSLLTGKDEDKGHLASITNAYGFEVEVRNVGNEDITEASIEIRLHESAKIIEHETNPPPQKNYEISFERDSVSPNVVRVLVPYINRRDRFLVRLISTENTSRVCHVDVRGLGIQVRRHPEIRRLFTFMAAIVPIGIFMAIAQIFPQFLMSLGVRNETKTITTADPQIPAWLVIFMVLLIVVPVLIAFATDLRNRPRRTKEYGSGGVVVVQDWDVDKRE